MRGFSLICGKMQLLVLVDVAYIPRSSVFCMEQKSIDDSITTCFQHFSLLLLIEINVNSLVVINRSSLNGTGRGYS